MAHAAHADAIGSGLLAGAMWSYAATVLYPAQALKRAGVSIGAARSATRQPGSPAWARSAFLASLRSPGPPRP